MAATAASHLAKAAGSGGNNGGEFAIAQGHLAPVRGEAGHSGNAPSDLKPGGANARDRAPGEQNRAS